MNEIYTNSESNNHNKEITGSKETGGLSSEVSSTSGRELAESSESRCLTESRENAEASFDRTIESVFGKYENYISEADKNRIEETAEISRPVVMSESEYIEQFPGNDLNVLGHFDPVNEKIYIKDNKNEIVRHVSAHESMHLCSHNEITADIEGNTVVRSGIRETIISEEGIKDQNRGINEGITEMYALRELESQGDTEAAGFVTSYPEARGYACLMEEIVGSDIVADAYFGGNSERLKSEFSKLNESAPTAWESFSKDIETVEYGTSYTEITAARTRISIMLMEMSVNKETING